jgi:hypothetical protein
MKLCPARNPHLIRILIHLLDINVTGKKLKHKIHRPTQCVLKFLHMVLITKNGKRFNSNFSWTISYEFPIQMSTGSLLISKPHGQSCAKRH